MAKEAKKSMPKSDEQLNELAQQVANSVRYGLKEEARRLLRTLEAPEAHPFARPVWERETASSTNVVPPTEVES